MPKVPILAIVPLVIFLGLAGLFMLGLNRDDPDALPSALEGRPAPVAEGLAFADFPGWGEAEMQAPGIKIVNVWASWCAPCRAEHPTLMALAESGLKIYGINYRDRQDNAEAFLKELGNPYAGILADPASRVSIEWGVYGVPETYVIDSDGIVQLRVAGPVTNRVMRERVQPVLDRIR